MFSLSDFSPTMKCCCCLMTRFVIFFRLFFASELAHATNKKWILLLSFALLSSPSYACINWKIEIFMEISLRQPVARSRLPMCTPKTRAKFFKFIFLSLDGAWKADDVHHMGFSCFSIYVKIIFIRPDPSGWMSPPIQDALLIYALISRLFSWFSSFHEDKFISGLLHNDALDCFATLNFLQNKNQMFSGFWLYTDGF